MVQMVNTTEWVEKNNEMVTAQMWASRTQSPTGRAVAL